MHKESTLRYFTLRLNNYIICEISYEQVHKESTLRYFTLCFHDYIFCEICYEQVHKELTIRWLRTFFSILVQNSEFLFRILRIFVYNSCSEFMFRIFIQNSWLWIFSAFLFRMLVQIQMSCSQFLFRIHNFDAF